MDQDQLERLLAADDLARVSWSALALDVASGRELWRHDPDRLLPSASLGKVFLLVEVAESLLTGRLSPHFRLTQGEAAAVADSGLWRHLAGPELLLVDAAVLVGAVSDNLATNALLDVVGLPTVQKRAADLAPGGSTLLDIARDRRGPEDPPALSRGCAADWAPLVAALARGEVGDVESADQVVRWLTAGTDLSMVASGFGLDPLAHGPVDGPLWLWSKTGTTPGVRADAGVATYAGRSVAWAVLAAWDEAASAEVGAGPTRAVLAAMRALGEDLRSRLVG